MSGLEKLSGGLQAKKLLNCLDWIAVSALATLAFQDDNGKPLVPYPHHQAWLELVCNEDITKLLIIAPPEAAKTTWIQAYLATYIGFYPERSVIIGSVSDDVAEKRSLSMRTTIESQRWQMAFPNVMPDSNFKWEQKEWTVAENGKSPLGRQHPTMRSYGTGASIIGSRADLLVGDDILDLDNTRTKHQRELVETWFYTSFMSRLKAKTGRVILIGTSWNADDLYSHIRQKPDGWVISHVPQLSPVEDGMYMDITYAN